MQPSCQSILISPATPDAAILAVPAWMMRIRSYFFLYCPHLDSLQMLCWFRRCWGGWVVAHGVSPFLSLSHAKTRIFSPPKKANNIFSTPIPPSPPTPTLPKPHERGRLCAPKSAAWMCFRCALPAVMLSQCSSDTRPSDPLPTPHTHALTRAKERAHTQLERGQWNTWAVSPSWPQKKKRNKNAPRSCCCCCFMMCGCSPVTHFIEWAQTRPLPRHVCAQEKRRYAPFEAWRRTCDVNDKNLPHGSCVNQDWYIQTLLAVVYLRTASFLGSRALAVCWIWPIFFWRTQTRWLVHMMSFSSSWNREQACRARSDSCRRVRERTTLLMAHRSSKSRPSSLGIWCLHRSCGSTILLANGILFAKMMPIVSQE